jgi:hypothetical protein
MKIYVHTQNGGQHSPMLMLGHILVLNFEKMLVNATTLDKHPYIINFYRMNMSQPLLGRNFLERSHLDWPITFYFGKHYAIPKI